MGVMTPERVKQSAAKCDCKQCVAITSQDLFIGVRAPINKSIERWENDGVKVLKYPARCNGCGRTIPAGEAAKWEKGRGAWHIDCFK